MNQLHINLLADGLGSCISQYLQKHFWWFYFPHRCVSGSRTV